MIPIKWIIEFCRKIDEDGYHKEAGIIMAMIGVYLDSNGKEYN